MIELNNSSFKYCSGGREAISSLSARIPEGIHLLAGENGAGKTTLLHLIAGVATPCSGECLIDGVPANTDIPSLKGKTFLLEENTTVPLKTIRKFAAAHSRFYPSFSEEVFEENLRAFGLTGNEPIRRESLGNRKKAMLAYVLALGVEVLLLDEPTNALDIQSKETLRHLIAGNCNPGQTIIISTHTVGELENLFDGAIMIRGGHLLFAASEEEITSVLAFSVERVPNQNAIYAENQIGRSLNILPADSDSPTKADWRLLYSSLYSPMAPRILELIYSCKKS